MLNDNCQDPLPSTTSSCEAILGPTPMPSIPADCDGCDDDGNGGSVDTGVIISKPNPDAEDILCKEFGICPESTSSKPPKPRPSTTSSSPATSSNPCFAIGTIGLSWTFVPSLCNKLDYSVYGSTQILTSPKIVSVYSASLSNGRNGTWQFSNDGGRTWETFALGTNSASGQTDSGWMKNRYSFLLRVLTVGGSDIFQMNFNPVTGVGLATQVSKSRLPIETGCVDDYYELSVPSPYRISDVTLDSTGDVTISRIDTTKFSINGLIGQVTGRVRLSCGGGTEDRDVPALFGDGGGKFSPTPSTGGPIGSVQITPTENACEFLVVLRPGLGVFTRSPFFRVSGGAIKQVYNPTTILITSNGLNTCVNAEYFFFENRKYIESCVAGCIGGTTTTSSDVPSGGDCGNEIVAWATKDGSIFPCAPADVDLDVPAFCGGMSLEIPKNSGTTSSAQSTTSSLGGVCSFSIGNVVRPFQNDYRFQILNQGTQVNFGYQVLDMDGVVITPFYENVPLSDGYLFVSLGIDFPYGLYQIEVIAVSQEGATTFCSAKKTFAHNAPSTSTAPTTSTSPCTIDIDSYTQNGGVIDVHVLGISDNENFNWKISTPAGNPIYPSNGGSVYPERLSNGFFSISFGAIAQNNNVVNGNYIITVEKGQNSGCKDTIAFSWTNPVTTSSVPATTSSEPVPTTSSEPSICDFEIVSLTQDGPYFHEVVLSGAEVANNFYDYQLFNQDGTPASERYSAGNLLNNRLQLCLYCSQIPFGNYTVEIRRYIDGSGQVCARRFPISYTAATSSTSSAPVTTSSSPVCSFTINRVERTSNEYYSVYIDNPGTQVSWEVRIQRQDGSQIFPTQDGSWYQAGINNGRLSVYINPQTVPVGTHKLRVRAAVSQADGGTYCYGEIDVAVNPATTSSTPTNSSSSCSFQIESIQRLTGNTYRLKLINIGTQVNFGWRLRNTDGSPFYPQSGNNYIYPLTINGQFADIDFTQAGILPGNFTVQLTANQASGSQSFCYGSIDFSYTQTTSSAPTTSSLPPTTSSSPTTSSGQTTSSTPSTSSAPVPGITPLNPNGAMQVGAASLNLLFNSGNTTQNPQTVAYNCQEDVGRFDYNTYCQLVTPGLAESQQSVEPSSDTTKRFKGGNTVETALWMAAPTYQCGAIGGEIRYYSYAFSLKRIREQYPSLNAIDFDVFVGIKRGVQSFPRISRVNVGYHLSNGLQYQTPINGQDYAYKDPNGTGGTCFTVAGGGGCEARACPEFNVPTSAFKRIGRFTLNLQTGVCTFQPLS